MPASASLPLPAAHPESSPRPWRAGRRVGESGGGGGAGATWARPWKHNVAKKLSMQWQIIGGCGLCCLVLSTLSLFFLSNPTMFLLASGKGGARDSDLPAWFDDRPLPRIITTYVDAHTRAVNSPVSSGSLFLVHEMPGNGTAVVDTVLGLVSSFMLAMLTDRALLVQWTDGWATPLDQLSVFRDAAAASPGVQQNGLSGLQMSSAQSSLLSGARDIWGSAFPGRRALGDPLLWDDDVSGGGGGVDGGGGSLYGDDGAAPHLNASLRTRRVGLADALVEPGLKWDFEALAMRYERRTGKPAEVAVWDPLANQAALTCADLRQELGGDRFVKVRPGKGSTSYFLPLLLVNPHYAGMLGEAFQGGAGWAFADLVNFLVRPVAEVEEAIDRFKARYMDGNMVIAMQMSVMPGGGAWAGGGLMPAEQQARFFAAAGRLVEHDDSLGGRKGVVFLLVTDSPAQVDARLREAETMDAVSGAGVLAILAAAGDGVPRVHLELQELFALGFADAVLTTPASAMGIVGAARTHLAPHVVLSEEDVHASKAPYPCFAKFGLIQHEQCFEPQMLGIVPPDSLVPC